MGSGARPSAGEPVRIRPATADDLAAIHDIESASFGDPWSRASFESMITHPAVRFTVAESEGEILGYAVAWIVPPEGELANIAVARIARRRGVGAALLDDLLEQAEALGMETMFLEVRASNERARRLYESRGFAEVSRRTGYYSRPTEDAVVMRRTKGDPSASL